MKETTNDGMGNAHARRSRRLTLAAQELATSSVKVIDVAQKYGYEHSGGPELEVLPPGDDTADDDYCEVWIPIVER